MTGGLRHCHTLTPERITRAIADKLEAILGMLQTEREPDEKERGLIDEAKKLVEEMKGEG